MTMDLLKSEIIFAESINNLIEEIRQKFQPRKLDQVSQIVKNENAADAMQYGGRLSGKFWNLVSEIDFSRLDASGVRVALTASGLVCYLPMFMTHVLDRRAFGWFEEMLLPVGFDLEDVVEQFSGTSLEYLDNSFRAIYHERVVYAKEHLLPEQLECVARYIEIAESYGVESPTSEFLALLKKYTDFWRYGSVKPS